MSTEILQSLLPLFMVSVLGASVSLVGLIDGLTEATASFTKMLSGALSDHLRKRKLLTLAGYSLAALSKPLVPLSSGLLMVFFARFLDRLGKGVRDAPRDALIADIVAERYAGRAARSADCRRPDGAAGRRLSGPSSGLPVFRPFSAC